MIVSYIHGFSGIIRGASNAGLNSNDAVLLIRFRNSYSLRISKVLHSKKGEKTMLTIKEIQALYFDKTALREPLRKLRRVDGGDLRWYYTIENDEIVWFISVTSLLTATMPMSEHLLKWIADRGIEKANQERDEKAAYGTAMHIACERYLLDKFNLKYDEVCAFLYENSVPLKYANQLQKDILSFAQFCMDRDVKPLAVEIMLSDTELRLAGACDLVCQMTFNGKKIIALVDMKSGRKGFWEESEIQLHAYKQLFEKEFDDIKIDKVFSWSPKDWISTPTYNLKDQTNSSNADKLSHLLEIFKISNPPKPSPRIMVDGTIRLGEPVGNKFKVIDLEDYIRFNDNYFTSHIPVKEMIEPTKVDYLTDDDIEVENPFDVLQPKKEINYMDF